MDTPHPPDRVDNGYYKTQVVRLLNLPLHSPNGLKTYRFVVSDTHRMSGGLVAARLGTLFYRVRASGELSIQIRAIWTIEGSGNEIVWSSQRAGFDTVESIQLWEGPVPGAIQIEIDNLGPPETIVLEGDLCARRAGSNFNGGMWFRDLSRLPTVVPQPLDHVPQLHPPERPQPTKRKNKQPCNRPRARRFVSTALPMPKQARAKKGQAKRTRIENNFTPLEQPYGYCDPDPRAVDWVQAIEGARGLGGVVIPDPEAQIATMALGGEIILERGGADRFPGGNLTLPGSLIGVIEDATEGAPFEAYLGRCEGFHDLWMEVSQGLEEKRLPVWFLDTLIDNGTAGPSFSIDAKIRNMAADHGREDRDWVYKVSAPWFDGFALGAGAWMQTWYLSTILNLVGGTVDLIPPTIRSPRTGRRDAVINRVEANWRITGYAPPSLRVGMTRSFEEKVVWIEQEQQAQTPEYAFDLASGTSSKTVNSSVHATIPEGFVEQFGDHGASGGTTPLFWPIPTRIRLYAGVTATTAMPAAKLYQVARLLTMLLVTHEDALRGSNQVSSASDVDDYEAILDVAKTYYKLHLGMVVVPASTFVHELFHTIDQGKTILYYLKELATGSFHHCHTGCGQEKMATAWLQGIFEEYQVGMFLRLGPWPSGRLVFAEEADGNGGVVTFVAGRTIAGGSRCLWRKLNTDKTPANAYGGVYEPDTRKLGVMEWEIRDAGLQGSELVWSLIQVQDARVERIQRQWDAVVDGLEADQARLRSRGEQRRESAAELSSTNPGQARRLLRRARRDEARVRQAERGISAVNSSFAELLRRAQLDTAQQCWDGTARTWRQ